MGEGREFALSVMFLVVFQFCVHADLDVGACWIIFNTPSWLVCMLPFCLFQNERRTGAWKKDARWEIELIFDSVCSIVLLKAWDGGLGAYMER